MKKKLSQKAVSMLSESRIVRKSISVLYGLFAKGKTLSRGAFLKMLPPTDKVLEIGPFTNPCIRGENVFYFDVLNKEDLIKRALEHNYPVTEIPEIHFVSAEANLAVVDQKFDKVLSSHCIEHQPDLIKHLKDVSTILNPDGAYFLIIPDKRFCFDALLPESNIGAVIAAHQEKRTRHSLKSVIEHRALTTHNNSFLHWAGNHGLVENNTHRVISATNEFENAKGSYVDVHAWQFTPDSFAGIINQLFELKYVDLQVSEIYTTSLFNLEFYVVLKKTN